MIIKVIDMIIMIIEAAVIAIVKDTEVGLGIEMVKEDQDQETEEGVPEITDGVAGVTAGAGEAEADQETEEDKVETEAEVKVRPIVTQCLNSHALLRWGVSPYHPRPLLD